MNWTFIFFISMVVLTISMYLTYKYLLYRNSKVFELRLLILRYYPELYKYLPEYGDMLYSIKPLTKKYWLKYCLKQNSN